MTFCYLLFSLLVGPFSFSYASSSFWKSSLCVPEKTQARKESEVLYMYNCTRQSIDWLDACRLFRLPTRYLEDDDAEVGSHIFWFHSPCSRETEWIYRVYDTKERRTFSAWKHVGNEWVMDGSWMLSAATGTIQMEHPCACSFPSSAQAIFSAFFNGGRYKQVEDVIDEHSSSQTTLSSLTPSPSPFCTCKHTLLRMTQVESSSTPQERDNLYEIFAMLFVVILVLVLIVFLCGLTLLWWSVGVCLRRCGLKT